MLTARTASADRPVEYPPAHHTAAPDEPVASMTITVAQREEAERLLLDPLFQQEWMNLHAQCPWATAFQTLGFISAWFQSYKSLHTPVLLFERSSGNELRGLLPLAVEKSSSRLVVAGAHQAEYQAWLAQPANGNLFIRNALLQLQKEFPRAPIVFKYIPPGTPMEWMTVPSHDGWRCLAKRHERPLIRLDDKTGVEKHLQPIRERRANKYKLNKLKRLGAVRIEHLRDPAQLKPLLDRWITFYDIRQAWTHGSAPFREDPAKRAFQLALLGSPDLLHVTLLRAGDEVLSAMFGVAGSGTFSLGMPMFSPFHADMSPMTWHMLMLIELLQQEGFSRFDLTPGLDPFKQEFAVESDSVESVEVFFQKSRWARRAAQDAAGSFARRALALVKIQPSAVRNFAGKISWDFASRALRWCRSRSELQLYVMEAARASALEPPEAAARDRLEDLLAFWANSRSPGRSQFLADALKRVARGNHFYTAVRDGALLHCAWLAECKEKIFLSEAGQEFNPPAGSVLLSIPYMPQGAKSCEPLVRRLLYDAARIPVAKQIFFSVPAKDGELRALLESLGFVRERSLFQRTLCGKSRQWSSRPSAPPAAE